MIYRISHITDLLQVPPEHWEECMHDLRGAVISLHLVKSMASLSPGADFDVAAHCPYIDFKPDGKGEVTPMLNDEPMFVMTVKREGKPEGK